MNFSQDARVTIDWNGMTVDSTPKSYTGYSIYYTVNGTIVGGDTSGDFSNTITLKPSSNLVVINWELRNTASEVVASGTIAGDDTQILSWNTSTTDYNNYTLWFEVSEKIETPLSLDPVTINFTNPDPANVQFGWTANGTPVAIEGSSASYTHNYTEQTLNGVIQNPDAQYYGNSLSMTVAAYNKANWTITKGGATIASGSLAGGTEDNTSAIYNWNTKTQDLDGATVSVTTEFDPGDYYFIVKANPEHFTSITGGTSSPYSETVNYSPTGEYNFHATGYIINIVGKSNVEYTVKIYNEKGDSIGQPYTNKSGTAQVSITSKYMKGTVEITSYELLSGGPWSYTVIGNPEHIDIRDAKADNATIPCSVTGTSYQSSANYTQPQISAKVANLSWNAYFFPAGADTSDKNLAIAKLVDQVRAVDTYYTALYPNTISNTNYNNGTLLIESEVGIGSGEMTIYVVGNAPKYLKTDMGGDTISVAQGSNKIAISSRYLTFTHKVSNTKQFYKVMRNGDIVAPTETAGEGGGGITYSYNFNNVRDGDEFYIEIDYPVGPHDVIISVPDGCDSFIQSITVEDVDVTASWQNGVPIKVTGGQTVVIQGDEFNYIVGKPTINGVEAKNATASYTKIIGEAFSIAFDVTPIQRTKSFQFETGSLAAANMRTSLGSFRDLEGFNGTIEFSDDDNPITFNANCTSDDENTDYACQWYLNGAVARANSLSFTTSVQQDDVVMVEFVVDGKQVTTYKVDFALQGALVSLPSIVVDGSRKVLDATVYVVEGQQVVISDNADTDVTAVKVNDIDIVEADNAFSFNVSQNSTVKIYGNPIERNLTLNVYVTGVEHNNGFTILEQSGRKNLVVGTLGEGANTVKFNAEDLPLQVSAVAADGYASAVFLNDAAVEYNLGYTVNCADNDALHVIFEPSGTETETVDLGTRGMRTFVSHYDCTFDDSETAKLKAFICTGLIPATGEITLERVTGTVPAGTGLLLYGDISDGQIKSVTRFTAPVAAPGRVMRAASLGSNLLQPVYQYTTIPSSVDDDDNDFYVLPMNSDQFAKTASSSVSDSNQAILVTDANDVSSMGVTGVKDVAVSLEPAMEGIYTVTGIKLDAKVSDLAPGVYIVNGRKVFVK